MSPFCLNIDSQQMFHKYLQTSNYPACNESGESWSWWVGGSGGCWGLRERGDGGGVGCRVARFTVGSVSLASCQCWDSLCTVTMLDHMELMEARNLVEDQGAPNCNARENAANNLVRVADLPQPSQLLSQASHGSQGNQSFPQQLPLYLFIILHDFTHQPELHQQEKEW